MKQKLTITNKKTSFDYEFLEKFTAGIQLMGNEVKIIKNGKISINDCFCHFKNNELYVKNLILTESSETLFTDPKRDKKLLLKKSELRNLQRDLTKGLTIIVYKVLENEKGKIKVEIALARGKKNYDKRNSIKEKDQKREKNLLD